MKIKTTRTKALFVLLISAVGIGLISATTYLTQKTTQYKQKAEEAVDRCSLDIEVVEDTPIPPPPTATVVPPTNTPIPPTNTPQPPTIPIKPTFPPPTSTPVPQPTQLPVEDCSDCSQRPAPLCENIIKNCGNGYVCCAPEPTSPPLPTR